MKRYLYMICLGFFLSPSFVFAYSVVLSPSTGSSDSIFSGSTCDISGPLQVVMFSSDGYSQGVYLCDTGGEDFSPVFDAGQPVGNAFFLPPDYNDPLTSGSVSALVLDFTLGQPVCLTTYSSTMYADCLTDLSFVADLGTVFTYTTEAGGGGYTVALALPALFSSFADTGVLFVDIVGTILAGAVALLCLGYGTRLLKKYVTGRKF